MDNVIIKTSSNKTIVISNVINSDAILEEKFNEHCPGTRNWVIEHIQRFLAAEGNERKTKEEKYDNKEKNSLFWLIGGAGMGKSVTAALICKSFHDHLVMCHFCRHDDQANSNGIKIARVAGMAALNANPMIKKQITKFAMGL